VGVSSYRPVLLHKHSLLGICNVSGGGTAHVITIWVSYKKLNLEICN
jgi:hypothetical protein